MITEALLHFPGIGPARREQLHERDIRAWSDVLQHPDVLPTHLRDAMLHEAARSIAALEQNDIRYLVERLHAKDKWRILTHYLDQTTFFDIETDGLEIDSHITVIACWHRGHVHTFVEHENLDEFLTLLEDVQLLASFNGNSFDVPRVLDAFHIPCLPCPHLDLRWLCYHQGQQGGLKHVASRMGIQRPLDLSDADGALAIRLWMRWLHFQDRQARDELLRYCASDAALLRLLAMRMAGPILPAQMAEVWDALPAASRQAAKPQPEALPLPPPLAANFGDGSPRRLRARLRGSSS